MYIVDVAGIEESKMILKVGDKLWSPFFGKEIVIVEINSDNDWKFEIEREILKSRTLLSYFEQRPELKINPPWTQEEIDIAEVRANEKISKFKIEDIDESSTGAGDQ